MGIESGGILVGVGRVNGRDEGEVIWLLGFIYIYKIRVMKPCNCFKWGGEGVGVGRRWWGQSS
jgi:hypothetical protein